MEACLNLNIPVGYTVEKKKIVMDIDSALDILRSRRRKKYISAHRTGYDNRVELRRDLWRCPYCNLARSTPFMYGARRAGLAEYIDTCIGRSIIHRWGTDQISVFGNEFENIKLNPVISFSGEMTCPKCGRVSTPAMADRDVCMTVDSGAISIRAEVCGLSELLSLPWIAGRTVTLRFPIYEKVVFDLSSGRTCITLQTADGETLAERDLTEHAEEWKNGVVYGLMRDNVIISRTVKRAFTELCDGQLPFTKEELTPSRYIQLTRFTGLPRAFYDAVPYVLGSYRIEPSFADIASRLRTKKDALAFLQSAELPKSKSVRRIFFSSPGLLFYLEECSQLWRAVGDVNYFCRLLSGENIFDLLSTVHKRPILMEFIREFCCVKGKRTLVHLLTREWERSINYAIDYCTMSASLRCSEQEKWKNHVSGRRYYGEDPYDDDEDEEDELRMGFLQRRCSSSGYIFSIPMRAPAKSIHDCEIDGFSFVRLRCGNEYYMAGKELQNCLVSWGASGNPVVIVKRDGKTRAAIEVNKNEVVQARGYSNNSISFVAGLPEAYEKWKERFALTDAHLIGTDDLF